jgi:uracil-DNA glycosylase family 4
MEKSDSIDNLYKEYKNKFEGEEIVLGEGNLDAKLLLIGEAPGRDEVRLSRPFVGMAGKNLDEFLRIMGIERESIYITNAIKYRLSKINPKTGRVVNRPATKEEIDKNREYLVREIDIICPEYVATVGNVPLKAVSCRNDITIGQVHGTLISVDLSGKSYKLYPMYHPASTIYNRSLKESYIEDIEKLSGLIKQ